MLTSKEAREKMREAVANAEKTGAHLYVPGHWLKWVLFDLAILESWEDHFAAVREIEAEHANGRPLDTSRPPGYLADALREDMG